MEGGYIKLFRSILKWEWYDNPNVKVLFIHLLLDVNFTEGKWHGYKVMPGQVITSIAKLAAETGLTAQEVRTALSKLKKTGEITTQSTRQNTIITVEKYRHFQFGTTDSNIQVTNEQLTSNIQVTNEQLTSNIQATNEQQQYKKEKKEKKEEEGKEGEEGKKGIYQQIADMYNATCVSFPRCTKLSQARKNSLKARLNFYTVEDFKRLFETAEKSDFLKGANAKNWRADFEWLIAEKNMLKTLEGRYDNRQATPPIPPLYQQNSTGNSNNPFFNMLRKEGGEANDQG